MKIPIKAAQIHIKQEIRSAYPVEAEASSEVNQTLKLSIGVLALQLNL